MSEQDKRDSGGTNSPVVVVDSSRHSGKQLFRPIEAQEETVSESHHKRAKAPAVPSVTEEFKDNDEHILEHEMSSENDKHILAKNLSASQSKRGSAPEIFAIVTIDSKKSMVSPMQPIPVRELSKESALVLEKVAAEKKDDSDDITEETGELRTPVAKKSIEWKSMLAPTQPIPERELSKESALVLEKVVAKKKDESDDITEETAELRTPSLAKKSIDWSKDEEEAGGLPQPDSRASRVITAMRHMFCCGATLETPSEDEISPHCYEEGGI